MTRTPAHSYFVYRIPDGSVLDLRCPIGAVIVRGADELDAINKAYDVAESRYDCRESEILICAEVTSHVAKRQVLNIVMDYERLRAFAMN